MDTSEAAVKARSEDLSEHVSTLTLASDAELSPNQRLDKFFKFVDVRSAWGGGQVHGEVTFCMRV